MWAAMLSSTHLGPPGAVGAAILHSGPVLGQVVHQLNCGLFQRPPVFPGLGNSEGVPSKSKYTNQRRKAWDPGRAQVRAALGAKAPREKGPGNLEIREVPTQM